MKGIKGIIACGLKPKGGATPGIPIIPCSRRATGGEGQVRWENQLDYVLGVKKKRRDFGKEKERNKWGNKGVEGRAWVKYTIGGIIIGCMAAA